MRAWPRRELTRHPYTVINRVMAGVYRAEKINTHNGPTWMIGSHSLTTTGHSKEVSGSDGPLGEPEPPLRGEACRSLASSTGGCARGSARRSSPEGQA